jgi:hypothetical protein
MQKEDAMGRIKVLLLGVVATIALLASYRPVTAAVATTSTAHAVPDAPGTLQGQPFATLLTGVAEVPGPGDRNGIGVAALTLNSEQGHVCFLIHVTHVAFPITAAHIHQGSIREAGPIVVGLFSGTDEDGVLKGCVTADPAVIEAIRTNPTNYYVNVHNEVYPAGAVRGQLF